MAKSHRIPKKHGKELLALPECVRDDELSRKLEACGVEIYRLPNSAVLVVFDSRFDLYEASEGPAFERFIHLLLDVAKTPTGSVGRHVLDGLLPSGERFPELASELVDQLAERTGLDRALLDFSDKSLVKLDKALWLIGKERVYSAEIFEPLLAYVYALARQRCIERYRVFPRVEMRLEHGVWTPWLFLSSTSSQQLYSVVVDQINDWKNSHLLRNLVPFSVDCALADVAAK
jgi:hypothetical protein